MINHSDVLTAADLAGLGGGSSVIGLGGIWTEALDDVAIVPLPASPERVEEALSELDFTALGERR